MRTAMSSEGNGEKRQGSNLLERLQSSIALLQRVKQAVLPLRCLNVGEHLHIKHQAFKPILLSRHAHYCSDPLHPASVPQMHSIVSFRHA